MSLSETHASVQDTQPVKMGVAFCLIYTTRDTLWRPVPTLLSKWPNMTMDLTQAALQGQLKQFCSPAQLAFLREYSCKHLACSIPIVEWVHTPTLLLRDAAVHTSSRTVPWQRPLTLNFWKMAKESYIPCLSRSITCIVWLRFSLYLRLSAWVTNFTGSVTSPNRSRSVTMT